MDVEKFKEHKGKGGVKKDFKKEFKGGHHGHHQKFKESAKGMKKGNHSKKGKDGNPFKNDKP